MNDRKDCASPRDMLDDALLRQILNDMHADENACANRRSGCGCGRNDTVPEARDSGRRSGCGCTRTVKTESTRGTGNRIGCGCGTPESTDNDRCTGRPGCRCSRCRQAADTWTTVQTADRECCVSGAGVPRLQGFPLVMSYTPNQDWHEILEPEEALHSGTLFSELYFPWYPSRCPDKKDCNRCTGGDNV